MDRNYDYFMIPRDDIPNVLVRGGHSFSVTEIYDSHVTIVSTIRPIQRNIIRHLYQDDDNQPKQLKVIKSRWVKDQETKIKRQEYLAAVGKLSPEEINKQPFAEAGSSSNHKKTKPPVVQWDSRMERPPPRPDSPETKPKRERIYDEEDEGNPFLYDDNISMFTRRRTQILDDVGVPPSSSYTPILSFAADAFKTYKEDKKKNLVESWEDRFKERIERAKKMGSTIDTKIFATAGIVKDDITQKVTTLLTKLEAEHTTRVDNLKFVNKTLNGGKKKTGEVGTTMAEVKEWIPRIAKLNYLNVPSWVTAYNNKVLYKIRKTILPIYTLLLVWQGYLLALKKFLDVYDPQTTDHKDQTFMNFAYSLHGKMEDEYINVFHPLVQFLTIRAKELKPIIDKINEAQKAIEEKDVKDVKEEEAEEESEDDEYEEDFINLIF
jgi:hypothetical protein